MTELGIKFQSHQTRWLVSGQKVMEFPVSFCTALVQISWFVVLMDCLSSCFQLLFSLQYTPSEAESWNSLHYSTYLLPLTVQSKIISYGHWRRHLVHLRKKCFLLCSRNIYALWNQGMNGPCRNLNQILTYRTFHENKHELLSTLSPANPCPRCSQTQVPYTPESQLWMRSSQISEWWQYSTWDDTHFST